MVILLQAIHMQLSVAISAGYHNLSLQLIRVGVVGTVVSITETIDVRFPCQTLIIQQTWIVGASHDLLVLNSCHILRPFYRLVLEHLIGILHLII